MRGLSMLFNLKFPSVGRDFHIAPEKSGHWTRENPFRGLYRRYQNRFPAKEPVASTLTDADYEIVLRCAQKYTTALQFIEISRCSGLRPSEVKNLNVKHLDRAKSTWAVLVTKTSGQQYYRTIAIPQYLTSLITNNSITGALSFPNLKKQLGYIREESGVYFTEKTFRKDFAHRLELVGADDSIINLHQGRGQKSGVLHKSYLTDSGRAAKLCRPYIYAMFGEKQTLSRVI